METIRLVYTGDLRTEATHVRSGSIITTDAPVDNQGKGEAFSPTDLLCLALGSCMMTTMGIAARNHAIDLDGTTMKITKVMASNPRRVAEAIIEFSMPPKSYSDEEKNILERAALTCPVALSLHEELKQTTTFNYSI